MNAEINCFYLEIEKVRISLFQLDPKLPGDLPDLPPPEGDVVSMQEHVNVPIDQHPDVCLFGIFYL